MSIQLDELSKEVILAVSPHTLIVDSCPNMGEWHD